MSDAAFLLEPIRKLHDRVWRAVVSAGERTSTEQMSSVSRDEDGDTIYGIDDVSEHLVVEFFEREIAPLAPLVLIAEGLPGGELVLPRGSNSKDAVWRVIVDPIDGTRGWMYQKRSAWILTGVAPNKGPETNLSDIVLAVQTEIPLLKQHLLDSFWAIRGKGTQAERINRLTGERMPLHPQPSRADSVAHGYATISRFFPGARDELAAIEEEMLLGALGPIRPGKALCFEDQYISTGGQFCELISGRDRFTADIRPLMEPVLRKRNLELGICCHPYDVCTELIAREAGVLITDELGGPLRSRLSVDPDISWMGYANAAIRQQLEPLLQQALRKRGLIS